MPQKDWEDKEFAIGDLVSSGPGGVWTYKFCPDSRTLPETHWEPGYHVFKGIGVVVNKKLQRVWYTTDFIESNGDWVEVKLKKPYYLDIWNYQIATPAGIVGWQSGLKDPFDTSGEFW